MPRASTVTVAVPAVAAVVDVSAGVRGPAVTAARTAMRSIAAPSAAPAHITPRPARGGWLGAWCGRVGSPSAGGREAPGAAGAVGEGGADGVADGGAPGVV